MAISISQFISLPFTLLDVHTYIHSVLAFLLTYGFNKNWMAQLHSAEWLNWTEMLSFLLASQPATILNQNSAAVYFELFQFPSTCYCKGAKICISPNWRPWWSVLLSSTQSGWKCIHRGREKKRWQRFSSVWIILFCKFLHRSFQTASLVFTQHLSLCRLSQPRALSLSAKWPRLGLWSLVSHSQSCNLQKKALSHLETHTLLPEQGGWAP